MYKLEVLMDKFIALYDEWQKDVNNVEIYKQMEKADIEMEKIRGKIKKLEIGDKPNA